MRHHLRFSKDRCRNPRNHSSRHGKGIKKARVLQQQRRHRCAPLFSKISSRQLLLVLSHRSSYWVATGLAKAPAEPGPTSLFWDGRSPQHVLRRGGVSTRQNGTLQLSDQEMGSVVTVADFECSLASPVT